VSKVISAAALGLGLVCNAYAQEPADRWVDIWGFGGGFQNSCATWLSSDRSRALGNEWIAGYWTGQNAENESNHMVGRTSDFAGIVGEIELICRAEPSSLLASAVGRVYVRFEQERR
jgi:hypothetical protein